MQINVAQLLKANTGTSQDYEVNEIIDVFGDGRGGVVRGQVRLLRTSRGILVKGMLNAEVELACSRCLSLFNYPVTLNIEEEYISTVDVDTGALLPLPEEPDSFTIDEHQVIDLTEAIGQYTVLAIPIKPLCREDCAGLCQNCGYNLNLGDCSCPPQAIDPRWSELSKLLNK